MAPLPTRQLIELSGVSQRQVRWLAEHGVISPQRASRRGAATAWSPETLFELLTLDAYRSAAGGDMAVEPARRMLAVLREFRQAPEPGYFLIITEASVQVADERGVLRTLKAARGMVIVCLDRVQEQFSALTDRLS